MRACVALLLLTQLAAGQGTTLSAQVAAHAGSATRLMQDRLYGDAAAEFEKALAIDPNNDGVRIQYATCLFAQERNDDARKQFEIERRRLGDREGLIYFLGLLDIRSENFTEAIRRLQPLASNPAFPKTSFYLGLAYLSTGQMTQAVEYLEKAAQRNPRDPEVHYRLGRVYSLAGRTSEADREYKLYRQWHENQRIAEQDGQACMDALRAQAIERAREVCNRIADPNDSRRLILLGQLYTDAGAFADAVDPLQSAVKLDPKSFEAWHYLGLSLYGLHRYQEAVKPLENAAAINPQFFETLNLLAKTFHVLGNDAAALPYLEQAHNLNPGDANVTGALERMRAALKAKP
jgi:tetratricopeptide (TPR) repeat protein